MSTYSHYQALPADGRLLARLRVEAPLYTLYKELLHRPCGPFDFWRLTGDEFEEVMEEIAGWEEFGSRSAVDRVLADLRGELDAACAAHAGLKDRAAYMQLFDDFEAALAVGLGRLGHPDPERYSIQLIHGFEPLGPDLFPGRTSELQLVPPREVAVAAGWLGRVAPESFGQDAIIFRSWQQVYLEAAPRGEAVVIG